MSLITEKDIEEIFQKIGSRSSRRGGGKKEKSSGGAEDD
mgnify:CR=1 FL=1